MLTKSDLENIKNILDERLDARLAEKLDEALRPIKEDILTIKKEVKPVKSMQKDIKKIRKTTDMMGMMFDKQM